LNGEHKITSSHRERAALIYQSTMAQVREHTESTKSQYALAGKAAALGWARSDIEVIDTDLGISGKWGVARKGLTELVTRVCAGDVGAIFGIEITRLARSNADVARLAEFARITGTLLIDPDGSASTRPVTAARPASTARHCAGVIRRARPAAVVELSPGTGVICCPAASAR